MQKQLARIEADYQEMLASGNVDAWLASLVVDVGALVGFIAAAREICSPVLYEALCLRAPLHAQATRLNAQRQRKRQPELIFFAHAGATDA